VDIAKVVGWQRNKYTYWLGFLSVGRVNVPNAVRMKLLHLCGDK